MQENTDTQKVHLTDLFSYDHGVYFILNEQVGHIKIGQTMNLSDRFKHVQAYNSCQLVLVALLEVVPKELIRVEKNLHNKFKHLQVRGEWFNYTDEIKKFLGVEL